MTGSWCVAVLSAVLSASPSETQTGPIPALRDRLAALSPDDPMGYFLLAEEVMHEMQGDRGLQLARTLFVLASVTDRRSSVPQGLTAGAALALASISSSDDERQWLLALIEPGSPRRPARVDDALQEEASLNAAEALSFARAGDAVALHERLRSDDVYRTLRRLGDEGASAIDLLERASDRAPCAACRNRRIIKSQIADTSDDVYTLCPICLGNPGPAYALRQYRETLAVEALLLGAQGESWSAHDWLSSGRAALEPDLDVLPEHFGVDPDRVRWNDDPISEDPLDGVWIR